MSCAAGERCAQGFCQPIDCMSNADCADGYHCNANHRCVPPRFCAPFFPCPNGRKCQAHICTP
jgi:hypothetical protein